MVSSSSPSVESLLIKFDNRCKSQHLDAVQIEREAKIFFAWCCVKGYDNCVFTEYLIGFAKGEWCPYTGWQK